MALVSALALALAIPSTAWATSFNCSHPGQGIHEIAAPESWPGTRAAHTVTWYGDMAVQVVYTKSGWWDPTWDLYYQSIKYC